MLSLFSPPTLGSRALSEDGRSTDDASSLSNAPTQEDVGNDNLPALTEEEEGGATSPLSRSGDLFNSGRSASASVAHNTDAAPAPPVALQPGVAFEGHLEKQADWLSSWRLRYFQVLEKGTLVYWLSADAATPRGLIELRDAAAIAVQTSDTSSGHVFVVKGPGTVKQDRVCVTCLDVSCARRGQPGPRACASRASVHEVPAVDGEEEGAVGRGLRRGAAQRQRGARGRERCGHQSERVRGHGDGRRLHLVWVRVRVRG